MCLFGTSCKFVRSYVTPYHVLSNEVGSYEYKFANTKNKPKLEFERIKSLVATRLTEFGWNESLNEDAQYVISIDYGMGSYLRSGSTPIIWQTSGGSTYHSGTVSGSYGTSSYSGTSYTAPTYGVVGSSSYSVKVNERFLLLIIRNEAGERVYTCFVKSEGSSSEINLVIDEMIDSVFKYFPGVSGKMYKVEVPWVQ